ncbi:MAG: NUDIX hydrolase [Saprospirales bacterium]|nr:MAG: NUDIX hydrolase [Saprospirales bacterium]
MKRGDWVIKSKKSVYKNPWIEVMHHEVTDPGGKEGIYGLVGFHNEAIAVIPVDTAMNTWLVGQYRFPLDRYSWEVPEGGGKRGTDPEANALRELGEETGLVAKELFSFLEMDLSNSVTDEVSRSFLALDLTMAEPNPESSENLRLRQLPLAEAFEMVEKGEIRDALSVASLIRLQNIILKNSLKSELDLRHFFRQNYPRKG